MREYRGEFEVHLTVLAPDAATRARFQRWCESRTIKCVWIVLARGVHTSQPMATWRRSGTTLPTVITEARNLADDLNHSAIPVVRVKVEAGILNEEVPVLDSETSNHESRSYFEHHVKLLRIMNSPSDILMRVCEEHGAHLSHNAFRQSETRREERFVTLRSYGIGRVSSNEQLQRLRAALNDLGESIIDFESEYCVFDSNLELDAGWLRHSV